MKIATVLAAATALASPAAAQSLVVDYPECLTKQVRRMDDGRSPAREIGAMAHGACLDEMLRTEDLTIVFVMRKQHLDDAEKVVIDIRQLRARGHP